MVSYGSIASIRDFSIDTSGDYTSLTDGDGNVILYKNIETLIIGGNTYRGAYDGVTTTGEVLNTSGTYYDPGTAPWRPGGGLDQLNFGNDILSSVYFDADNNAAILYPLW